MIRCIKVYCLSFKNKLYSGQQLHQSRYQRFLVLSHFACFFYFLSIFHPILLKASFYFFFVSKAKYNSIHYEGYCMKNNEILTFILSLFSHIRTEHGVCTVNYCIQSEWGKIRAKKTPNSHCTKNKVFHEGFLQ